MESSQNFHDIVNTSDFSRLTGINEHTVRRMCRDGELPARYLARRWLIDYDVFIGSLSNIDYDRIIKSHINNKQANKDN